MPYKDPEQKKAKMREWWAAHKEEQKIYRASRKEHDSKTHREWRKRNLEKRASDMREWRKNPVNRIASNLRSRISNALSGKIKSLNFRDSVGCSLDELKAWLEGWFEPGMSWENYGQWEIDHSRPCASFDLSKLEQQKQCFHYLNLRALWKPKNRSKGAKYGVH